MYMSLVLVLLVFICLATCLSIRVCRQLVSGFFSVPFYTVRLPTDRTVKIVTNMGALT